MIQDLESKILIAIGFDLEIELPHVFITEFIEKFVTSDEKLKLYQVSIRFCNDSFKLPLSLYHHPKVIAASCIAMAAHWLSKRGCGESLPRTINGHSWYKWVDAALDQSMINSVLSMLKEVYSVPQSPKA